jgi:myxalamid-type polyketide synthase MxaB
LPGESYQLEIVNRGFLDGLTLRAASRQKPGPDEVEIRVHATGLNFKDVLNTLGMVGSDSFPLGNECAGTIVEVGKNVKDFKPGDEAIAYAPGSFRSYLTISEDFVILKPEHISFEEAAGLLVVFHTAYATLHELGKMSKGDRVLIHAATGGVGMAALQLAQKAGAEIFATAGSERKRAFLRSLGVHHVLDSRSLNFGDEIMKITEGEGVDIVLNSLVGDFIPKSMSVLRKHGRFLEIGQRDILDKKQLEQLKEGVQYHVFDGTRLNRESVKFNLRELRKLWVDGSLKPLPVKVFPIEDAISAFRYMAQAKHIGKIIVTHKPMLTRAKSVSPHSDASYLITGGLGSLGLQIGRWMVEKGARHLVVMGRSDPSQEAQQKIRQLEQSGTEILVVKGDVALEEDVARTLEQIRISMPPLRGIVHAAGVLDDGMLLQQDWERFSKVLAPKVSGAWNLHVATREIPLDFFVLFSSAATLIPNYGQGNYSTANAFLDSLARYRKAEGLPAQSINWSAWGGEGMAASVGSRELLRWTEQGFSPMEPEDAFEAFEQVLTKETAQLAIMPVDWSSFFRHQKGVQMPAMLLELAEKEVFHSKAVVTVSEKPGSYLRQLEQTNPENRPDVLSDYIRKQVVKVLRLDSSLEIRPTQDLAQLGMDSLMAVELRNQIAKDVGVTMPVVTFLKGSSLSKISAMLLDKLTSAASIVGSPSPRSRDEIRSGLEGNSINDGWEEGEL